jgi:protein-tyrosine-phosphatase
MATAGRDHGLRRRVRLRPGQRFIDWDLQDPKGRPLDEVRATRDDIARRVDALVAELDRAAPPQLRPD